MTPPLTIVIAVDSFKGTLTADEATALIAEGWSGIRPHDRIVALPQADGGEGTLAAIAHSVPGSALRSAGLVTGPDGRAVEGQWLHLPDGGAVVELAQMCGITLMREPDPLGASTRGLGEVIAHALAAGATTLTVALGGSASTDGGAGALSALGAELRDSAGTLLPDGGGALGRLAILDAAGLARMPPLTLLTDVTSPLLGDRGAARVFGPQKGADATQVERLEAGLARFAALAGGEPTRAGMGAAGGTAFGFASAWAVEVVPGAEHVARLTGLPGAIARADAVITGEGRYDDQSASGKVCGRVLSLARQHGAVPLLIAGAVLADPGTWSASLLELAGSSDAAMSDAPRWLREAGRRAAREFRTPVVL